MASAFRLRVKLRRTAVALAEAVRPAVWADLDPHYRPVPRGPEGPHDERCPRTYESRVPTSCRNTYGRMPPWRNATSSSGVSIRATAVGITMVSGMQA